MLKRSFWQKYQLQLETFCVFVLAASVRLTSLNVFRAVDEEDRWAWAVSFYQALLAGDLPGTLVGDGYPGIFPVWLETIWLLIASLYRSTLQGGWFGDDGVYLLIHEWSRTTHLGLQRFPVVLTNTLLVVIIFLYLRKLFGQWVALLAAVLISLDPFYLSDSRVNRAEALLTGLMVSSLLALIAAQRYSSRSHLVVSAILAGLAWLTKSQALVLIPIFGAISLIWQLRVAPEWLLALRRWLVIMTTWGLIALAIFILLWPATWTVPGPTFSLMANYLTRKVDDEGVKIFFLGQTILDEDPGPLFYPLIFVLRATPLMLFGLILGLWLLVRQKGNFSLSYWRSWLDEVGVWALLAYSLLYIGGMSLGSHKQDRFLMAAFPVLNTLAALSFVYFIKKRGWSIRQVWLAGSLILALQLATALPFHPYYFSYFNLLAGGGPTAAQLTRIGWGEGMDQVGAYLQSLDNAESLVVAARFHRYLVGFKGREINLSADGEWLQADKIVFYIQQTQRMLDPSPGVIRYFEQHIQPEKVITINGIDYAQVYPNPIQYPADPLVDRLEGELNLFGYRWENQPDAGAMVYLIWENLGDRNRSLAVRLWANKDQHSDWLPCLTPPDFEQAAQTPGEVVESACPLRATNLPPGLYDLELGLQQPDSSWLSLSFSSGWSAVEVTAAGQLQRVTPEVAFARLAHEAVPASATWLEYTYADRVRLLAYELSPAAARPGQPVSVSLYWQALHIPERDAHVSLQAFLNNNERVALVNGPPLNNLRPTSSWRPGEVLRDNWSLKIPAETPAPALLRLDVTLFLPDTLATLPARNLAGEDIAGTMAEVRLEPPSWPIYEGDHLLNFIFGDAVNLVGYEAVLTPENYQVEVTLYWRSLAPLPESEALTAFVHLLDTGGTIVAQSDRPPADGLLPTSIWQSGDVILSKHNLALPAHIRPGSYTLLAGLYRPSDGARLPAQDENRQPIPNDAPSIGQITLP
jgi:hypothetical protein